MFRLQTAQLLYDEEQEESRAETRFEEVLRVVQEAHGA